MAKRAMTGLVLAAMASVGCGGGAVASGTTSAPPALGTATTPTAALAPAVPVGPGPQAHYTVQPQPAAGSCHFRMEGPDPLPDAFCTPGATSPAVTPATLQSTICMVGYTTTVRPPSSVTDKEKAGLLLAYGFAGDVKTTELDHLVPLELGGDPNDIRNLWPEPNDKPGAKSFVNGKDTVEGRAHDAVCAGRLDLATAQAEMASDWPALGKQLEPPK
jgi:hypothetical protein